MAFTIKKIKNTYLSIKFDFVLSFIFCALFYYQDIVQTVIILNITNLILFLLYGFED